MIKQLTDDARGALQYMGEYGREALRIIDQLTQDCDEWKAQHENLLAMYQSSVAEVDALKTEWAEHDGVPILEREVARLKEALAAAERVRLETLDMRDRERSRAEAAEARVRELKGQRESVLALAEARVRELKADRAAELEARGKYGAATVERLAAANAEVVRLRAALDQDIATRNATVDRLAAANALLADAAVDMPAGNVGWYRRYDAYLRATGAAPIGLRL